MTVSTVVTAMTTARLPHGGIKQFFIAGNYHRNSRYTQLIATVVFSVLTSYTATMLVTLLSSLGYLLSFSVYRIMASYSKLSPILLTFLQLCVRTRKTCSLIFSVSKRFFLLCCDALGNRFETSD